MNVHKRPTKSSGTSAGETSQMLLVRQLTLDGNESYDNVKGLCRSVSVRQCGCCVLLFDTASSFNMFHCLISGCCRPNGLKQVVSFDSQRSAAQLAAALMTNDLDEAEAELRRALEQFSKIAEDMEVSRCYCSCDRRAKSPCPLAQEQRRMLQYFFSDFDV